MIQPAIRILYKCARRITTKILIAAILLLLVMSLTICFYTIHLNSLDMLDLEDNAANVLAQDLEDNAANVLAQDDDSKKVSYVEHGQNKATIGEKIATEDGIKPLSDSVVNISDMHGVLAMTMTTMPPTLTSYFLLTLQKESHWKLGAAHAGNFTYDFQKLQCIVEKRLCEPDVIGAFLEEEGAALVHVPLQSIPETRRIPHTLANNDTYINERRASSPLNGTGTVLVEYNPTLLPLYKNLPNGEIAPDVDANKLLDWITGQNIHKDADQVKYISIQRSTNHHACGGSIQKMGNTVAEQCFCAISLLDKDLNTIPNGELVFDLDYYFLNKYARFKKNSGAYNCAINDVTLIAQWSTRDNPMKDQLFLIFSGSASSNMIPIDLRRISIDTTSGNSTQSMDDVSYWHTKIKNVQRNIKTDAPPATELAAENAFYGEGLQLRLLNSLVRTKTSIIRATREQPSFLDWRKNYHIFEAKDGSTWFETVPLTTHETRPINFFHDKFEYADDLNYFPNSTTYVTSKRTGAIRRSYVNQATESRYEDTKTTKAGFSFRTIFMKRAEIQSGIRYRGTACCGDMKYNGQDVKIGITHTVTAERSYLYAF